MVYMHPIEALKTDLKQIVMDFEESFKKKNSKTAKAITETFQMLNKSIEDRCQIALQRAQRKETEDTIFIQNNKEKIKDEKGCRDLVADILKKEAKVKEANIGHINVQTIKGKSNKTTFKVQLEPWIKKQHEMTKDGKKIKTSLSTTFFATVRAKPELLQQKDGVTTAERQIPAYLMNDKKHLDMAAKLIRDSKDKTYQTKVNFNAKENIIQGKFREKGTQTWRDIVLERKDIKNQKADEYLDQAKLENYIIDEKKTLQELKKVA